MGSAGLVHVDSGVRTRGRGLLDWLLVRDAVAREWVDSLPEADQSWLLTTTQAHSAVLSAQAAAVVAPLGVAAAALAAAVKHGIPSWLTIATVLCLSISGAHLVLSISRARVRLLILDRPVKQSELVADEAAAIHEKSVLLRRAVVWLLLGAVGVVAAAIVAVG